MPCNDYSIDVVCCAYGFSSIMISKKRGLCGGFCKVLCPTAEFVFARIIVTRHVGDGEITSAKLAEAFFKGRKQANTTNSLQTGLIFQHGWGFIQGNGTATLSEGVTFPIAFSAPPLVLCNFIGARGTGSGAPANEGDFTTAWSSFSGAYSDDVTASGFNPTLEARANHSSSFYFGYGWLAIGPA